MGNIIDEIYHNKLISRVFHTSIFCLKRELKGCSSVLDIGCGPSSPVQYCNVRYSVGVDVFKPYIDSSKNKNIHTKYILGNINDINFESGSFDAVVLVEVLEHLTKEQGNELLRKAQGWAKRKIIIAMPNGFLPQTQMMDNPFQMHRSGWRVREMRELGFKPYGMGGWKYLRDENRSKLMESEDSIFSTIRFRPKLLWMVVSELTQAIVYYLPELAFGVFYVKDNK